MGIVCFILSYAISLYNGDESFNLARNIVVVPFLTVFGGTLWLLLDFYSVSRIKKIIKKLNIIIDELGFDSLTDDNFHTSCKIYKNYTVCLNILIKENFKQIRIMVSVPLKGNREKVDIVNRFYESSIENNIIEIYKYNSLDFKNIKIQENIDELADFLIEHEIKP